MKTYQVRFRFEAKLTPSKILIVRAETLRTAVAAAEREAKQQFDDEDGPCCAVAVEEVEGITIE